MKFNFNDKFEIDDNSKVFLRGVRKEKTKTVGDTEYDITSYPKVKELLEIIKNKAFKINRIEVGDVYLAGKEVKDLLPYLEENEKKERKIIESDSGNSIKFITYGQVECNNSELLTGCYGKGEGDIITLKQLKEYYNRVINHSMNLNNITIEGLNSENYKGDFVEDMLTNVSFVNSDLSEISFESCGTGGGYLKFEDSTLPKTMRDSTINDLILKDSRLPKDLFQLAYFSDSLTSLRIYNKNKDDFFGSVKTKIYGINGHPPVRYIGPIELWKNVKDENGKIIKRRLEFIYNKKGYSPRQVYFTEEDLTDVNLNLDKIPFEYYDPSKEYTNHTDHISSKKSQSQFLLALIQNQGRSRG